MRRKDAHKLMRGQTLERMLKVLAVGPIDKRGIQKAAELSWGAVSDGIALLEANSVVIALAQPPEDGKLGRHPLVYKFNPSKNLAVGFVLEDTRTFASIVELSGNCIFQDFITHNEHLSEGNAQTRLEKTCADCMKKSKLPMDSLGGVGLSLPGAVSPKLLTWAYVPFLPDVQSLKFEPYARVSSRCLAPISIEHDVIAIARAVMRRENWSDRDFAFLNFSEGVGMSAAFNGNFFQGTRGYACEIGHIPVASGKNARPCRCGKNGCLETLLSQKGIALTAKERFGIGDGSSFERLLECMDEKSSKKLYEAIIPDLARACVVALNLFDPETLVVGGPALDPWLELFKQDLPQKLRTKSWLGSPAKIHFYKGGDRSECAYGAALGAAATLLSALPESLVLDSSAQS
jgi:predicted NBD/HSP70 family sugar kinase